MDQDFFWLSDAQVSRLEPFLPRDTRGKPRVDDRRVISGIIHVLISGCRWKDAPAVYGPRKTLYNRFQRWAAKGMWATMFHALASAGGPPAELLIVPLRRVPPCDGPGKLNDGACPYGYPYGSPYDYPTCRGDHGSGETAAVH